MRDDSATGTRTDSEGENSLEDRRSRLPLSFLTEDGEQNVSLHSSTTGEPLGDSTRWPISSKALPATGQESEETKPASDTAREDPIAGTVSLVGSGPGDPELLTRKAWNSLSNADVVLHDSLTGDEIVRQIPDRTDVIDVGKRPPNRTTQDEINELMLERSKQGEHVVRLKGGDPNVFGRGGEEAEYLASEDVAFEVVPGISSVLAAPSVGGFPLTHRTRASSVTVITGHQTPDKEESALNWSALAETITAGGTLVILMGVMRLSENVRALRTHRVPPETPVGMIQKATWADEEILIGTLGTIVEKCHDAEIESPATTIVGDVVNVRGEVEEQFLH